MVKKFGKRFSLLLISFFAIASLSACGDTDSVNQNIKVTVAVVDGDKTYSGSAVQWMKCVASDNSLGSTSIGGCTLKGEAVPVKIGEKGYLFLLLSGPDKWGPDPTYYPGAIQGNVSRIGQEKWDVQSEMIPIMATFSDLNDSRTVSLVDPNNLAASFGLGVTLDSVHVERTNEKYTVGQIEAILPWLNSIGFNNLSGEFSTGNQGDPLSTRLSASNFYWRN